MTNPKPTETRINTVKKWAVCFLATGMLVTLADSQAHALWPFGKKKDDKQEETSVQEIQSPSEDKIIQPKDTELPPLVDAPQPVLPRVEVKSPLSTEVEGLKVEDPVDSPQLPPDKTFVTIDDPKNPLGVTTSAQKLNDSAQMIAQKRYADAARTLNPLKDWLVDATEAHINLHKTLKALPNAQVQAELEKQLALQFALLRDKAFFQLGMLSVGQSDYAGAVKNLSRVIQSQPRSSMGAQAYEVLQKIGFTEKIQLREEGKSAPDAATAP